MLEPRPNRVRLKLDLFTTTASINIGSTWNNCERARAAATTLPDSKVADRKTQRTGANRRLRQAGSLRSAERPSTDRVGDGYDCYQATDFGANRFRTTKRPKMIERLSPQQQATCWNKNKT